MKINWGHKLVFFAGAFMVFIIVMVYRISTQKIDLVDDNYYEKGVLYQQDINKFAFAKEVNPQLVFDGESNTLSFSTTMDSTVSGILYLYRPSNETMDTTIAFTLTPKDTFSYSVNLLEKGLWKATFEWTYQSKLMAVEKQFVVK